MNHLQQQNAQRWQKLRELVDEGKATVVLYNLLNTINTGLEITNGASLDDEMDAILKEES